MLQIAALVRVLLRLLVIVGVLEPRCLFPAFAMSMMFLWSPLLPDLSSFFNSATFQVCSTNSSFVNSVTLSVF